MDVVAENAIKILVHFESVYQELAVSSPVVLDCWGESIVLSELCETSEKVRTVKVSLIIYPSGDLLAKCVPLSSNLAVRYLPSWLQAEEFIFALC